MAKQRALADGDGDLIKAAPPEVQEKADAYAAALRRLGNAKGKKNTAEEMLILSMKDNDCTEVVIDEGNKRIVLTKKEGLKIKKVKDAQSDVDDADEE